MKKKKQESEITDMHSQGIDPSINTDPFGSWTGVPDDPNDRPIQDADDL